MNTVFHRIISTLLLASLLPTLSGCNGGGGGIAGVIGSILGNSGGGSDGSGVAGLISPGVDIVTSGGETTLAMIHNPEPTTMLLMGGGLAAMAFFKKNSPKR